MSWLTDEKLNQIEKVGSLEDSFKAFLQHLLNEIEHGGGTTNPTAVAQACVDSADDLLDAIQAKAKAPPAASSKSST